MATNNGGSLSFDIKLMLDKLQADVQKANAELAKIGKTATDEGKKIDTAFNSISKSIAGIGAAFSAQQLARQIIQVRGEFEKLEVSFNTMLRSEEKASALMSQLVKTAATTPFGLQDVAGGAKQLLAYGMEAEKINETLIRLGDIAAGLNIPLQDMTYLFGTTMVQGRMYTQDLNQFVGRGIPLIKEFANQFGVAESKVKDLVTEGKIGFPQLQKAIIAMTSEGGQFAGLMEAQSKTIAGQIANLEDAIDVMFNNIGKASQGVVSDAIEVATTLVENYEQVLKILVTLVGTYGAYKLALLSVVAAQKLAIVATMTQEWYAMGRALGFATANQIMFNNASKANIYVALATAILGVVVAVKAFSKSEDESKKVIDECNEKIQQQQKELEELEKRQNAVAEAEKNAAKNTASEINRIELLVSAIHDETNSLDDRRKAIKELQSIVPNYNASLDDEGRLYRENTQSVEDYIDSLNRLAIAKALQSKREEIVSKRLSAEIDRRQAVKSKDDAEKAVNEANKSRDKAKKEYDNKMDEWEKSTNKSRNIFVRAIFSTPEGQTSMQATAEIERTALNAADQRVKVAEKVLETAQGAIKVADAKIKATNEDLAVLDDTMKGYNDELKQINKPKPATTGGGNGNADNQAQKEAERRLKLQQKLADDLLKMQQDNEQREIDAMDEGTAKRLAQINHDFEVRRKEIEKQEKDWKKQNIEAGITTEENGLTKEQSDALADAYAQNVQQQAKAQAELRKEEQQAMRDYLKEYGEYQEKRLAITEDYAERIKNAQNDGERKTLEAERDNALADLDTQATKTTSAIGKLFADMSNKSIAEMRKIAQEGQEALDFIQGGKWDAAKGLNLGITEEMFKNFKPEDIEQIRQAIEQLTKSADDCEVGFAKMKTSWEDFVKAKNPKELQDALQGIIDGVNDYMDVASFASDVIGGLGEAFDSDALKGIAEGINVAMDAVNAASQGAQVGSMFGPIGAAAGAAIGLISSLAQSIAEIYDKKKEKQIQALEDDIHDLEIAYDDLGRAIDKAYSTDAAKMIEEQNRMLEEQQRLIREQMQLEEDKKNTDEERLEQWEDELHDIDNQIADNKEAALDAIYGEDIQSAIENFADAYVGVWSDGSVKIKDVVRQMMQNMVKESIKATLQSSKAMEEIRQKMREFYADKEFQNWEQQELYKMAEEYQKQLDKDFAWAEDLFKDTTAQQASNGGFQAMSQDTGSELNGRFTTMVELQSLQLDKVRSLAIDTATISQNITEMRNLSLLSIGHLESIAKNTHELYQMNARLGRIEENTSRL